MKINVKAFSLACALFCGIGLFLITWWIIFFEGVSAESTIIGRVYRGYTISPLGSFIGFLWASADGLIGGAVLAWIYNFINCHQKKKAALRSVINNRLPIRIIN